MFSVLIACGFLSLTDIRLENSADGSALIRIAGGQGHPVAVFVANNEIDLPAVLGTTNKSGNDSIFTPRFPFEPGREYRVEFGNPKVTKVLRIPAQASSGSTVVQHIYPTSDRLPENQLKIYLEFSAPMSRGVAYDHIRLRDETGREVEHAFLELGEELWDGQQTRFTLLFDPGRVKRDLVPNIKEGAPLIPGGRYTLEVDAAWPDSKGAPLKKIASKQFSVTPADRTEPDPQKWTIRTPRRDSFNPLTIDFPEPMDFGLLLRTLRIVNPSGHELVGSVKIDNAEQRFSFTPSAPWRSGSYQIVIDGSLEDLAGNRIGRLFEVDTRTSPEMAKRASKTTTLQFSIDAAAE